MLRTTTTLSIPRCNRVASPVSFFVNREDEINAIVNILKQNGSSSDPEKRCVIRGNIGTGKTELCYAAAYRLLQEYPDAQIYLKVQENDSTDISLFKILETVIHIFDPFAQISADLNLLYNHYFSVLTGKKVLIILDDLPSGHNLHLLTPPSSCALLIATKENLEIPDIYSIFLSGLPQEVSEHLLVSICPQIGHFAATLASLCQNLPLN
ncbi:MAG TPA: hypothetical protein VH878_03195, partial [Thermodesulfobacteriota bacterium]